MKHTVSAAMSYCLAFSARERNEIPLENGSEGVKNSPLSSMTAALKNLDNPWWAVGPEREQRRGVKVRALRPRYFLLPASVGARESRKGRESGAARCFALAPTPSGSHVWGLRHGSKTAVILISGPPAYRS